nr:MAG TPA: hypothetical protein [Bacteriophage sp.]
MPLTGSRMPSERFLCLTLVFLPIKETRGSVGFLESFLRQQKVKE